MVKSPHTMNPMWFLRLARLARNPPSLARALFFVGILVACLGLAALDHWGLWPEWMSANGRAPRLPKP